MLFVVCARSLTAACVPSEDATPEPIVQPSPLVHEASASNPPLTTISLLLSPPPIFWRGQLPVRGLPGLMELRLQLKNKRGPRTRLSKPGSADQELPESFRGTEIMQSAEVSEIVVTRPVTVQNPWSRFLQRVKLQFNIEP